MVPTLAEEIPHILAQELQRRAGLLAAVASPCSGQGRGKPRSLLHEPSVSQKVQRALPH